VSASLLARFEQAWFGLENQNSVVPVFAYHGTAVSNIPSILKVRTNKIV
jgi:hypothetical protein